MARSRNRRASSPRIPLRMTGKDKIGHGGQHLEAQRAQSRHQFLPRSHNGPAGLFEVCPVFHGRHRAGDGKTIEGVGIETVLHPLQGFDESRVPDGETHPETGRERDLERVWMISRLGYRATSGTTDSPPKST